MVYTFSFSLPKYKNFILNIQALKILYRANAKIKIFFTIVIYRSVISAVAKSAETYPFGKGWYLL